MHLLAVLTGPHRPCRHRPLVPAEGCNNGLEWTAVTPQGEDQGHHIRGGPQPVEGCPRRRDEGGAAGHAPIALLHLAMHPNVPLAPLPSSRARQVVAELRLRGHRWPPPDAILQFGANHVRRRPEGPASFHVPSHLTTVEWGGTVHLALGIFSHSKNLPPSNGRMRGTSERAI